MKSAGRQAPGARASGPVLRRDAQRSRVPIDPALEGAARGMLGYLRDQHGMRRRRPIPRYLLRTAMFLAAAPLRPAIETRMGSLKVAVSTTDRTIARSVFASGDWDPLLVGTVFAALDELGHDYRGKTFLEVGANFGVYALPAVAEHSFARAVAYEPDPGTFQLLTRNIAHNGLGGRVRAFQVALSDRAGQVVLSRGRRNAGDNRIVGGGRPAGRRGADVQVAASTFDLEVAAGRIPLDELGLVWMDVQGHETQVLEGARLLLDSAVPVVLEYSTSMMTVAARRRLEDLVADNYDAMVDLGWSALTNRIRFQPATAILELVTAGRAVETDLLVTKQRSRQPAPAAAGGPAG